MKKIIIIFLLLIFSFSNVYAKNFGEVKCGVYPIHLYDFNFNDNNFKITFYLWCLSQAGYNLGKNIEVSNATDYKINFVEMDKVQNLDRSTVRITATVIKNWDLTYFPFDRQRLQVVIEDTLNEENKLIFVPDTQAPNLDESFLIAGWKIQNFELTNGTHIYKSNFGDSSTKNSKYSQLIFSFELKRHGNQLFFNMFVGFFLAFLLCFMSYFIPRYSSRFKGSLMMGAIFATIGNKYVVDKVIPPYATASLVEIIQNATISIVIYTILIMIIDMRQENYTRKIDLLNYFSAAVCFIFYIAVVGGFTIVAMQS